MRKYRKKRRPRFYKGTYKGIQCDSRWELAFLIYCLDKKQPIKRCTLIFPYTVRGKAHRYFPDFIIRNTIYEIKGNFKKNLNAKLNAVRMAGYTVKLIDKDKIQPYLEYCYKKYKTEHLEKLYD